MTSLALGIVMICEIEADERQQSPPVAMARQRDAADLETARKRVFELETANTALMKVSLDYARSLMRQPPIVDFLLSRNHLTAFSSGSCYAPYCAVVLATIIGERVVVFVHGEPSHLMIEINSFDQLVTKPYPRLRRFNR